MEKFNIKEAIEWLKKQPPIYLDFSNWKVAEPLYTVVSADEAVKDLSKQVQNLKDQNKFLDEQNITFGIQNTELRREIVELKAELYTERESKVESKPNSRLPLNELAKIAQPYPSLGD